MAATQDHQEICSGYLTKQGRQVKSWKRRWVILQTNGKLSYYSVRPGTKGAKLLGWMDTTTCSAILPGGRCVDCDWPRASLQYCFGLITPQRKLFLIADTVSDLGTWLRVFRSLLSPEIPVTNPREIEASFKPTAPLPEIPTTAARRITLLRNGADNQGRVVSAPTDMPSCLALASSVLGINAARLFTDRGGEITDFALVRDDDVIYVSEGEAFQVEDHATRLLRSALQLAEASKAQNGSGLPPQLAPQHTTPPRSEPLRARTSSSDDEQAAQSLSFSNPMQPTDDGLALYVDPANLRPFSATSKAVVADIAAEPGYAECQDAYLERPKLPGDDARVAPARDRDEEGEDGEGEGEGEGNDEQTAADDEARYMRVATAVPVARAAGTARTDPTYVDLQEPEAPGYMCVKDPAGPAPASKGEETPGYLRVAELRDEFSEEEGDDALPELPAPAPVLVAAEPRTRKLSNRVQF